MALLDATKAPATKLPGNRNRLRYEQVIRSPRETFVWRIDDYVMAGAGLSIHPEIEIRFIQRTSGWAFVGDQVDAFGPGYLAIVGPNVAHYWLTELQPGEVVSARDIVLRFDPELLRGAKRFLPELSEAESFLRGISGGLVFDGATAESAADLLRQIGISTGLRRLILFFSLVDLLSSSLERRSVCNAIGNRLGGGDHRVERALEYVATNLRRPIRMAEVARLVGMSEPAFSRFFRRTTGLTFTSYLRARRVAECQRLLLETSIPITDVCFDAGFSNLSNFNRQFAAETGLTPREYRRAARRLADRS